ncbi:hypothetical protein KKF84_06665 [Myxococcota bacterium]|nr:hypothetical protein [Myxococcota bacterium]MBU1534983.1 hypothetical protein [Myxococcota bacterium]
MKSLMNWILLTLITLYIASCSGSTESCTVVDNGDGTHTLRCDDGTEVTLQNGEDGEDGSNCSIADNGDGTYTMTCEDGTEVTFQDGEDGSNCAVTNNGDGTITIACDDGTEVTFDEGENGSSCTVTDNGDGSSTLSCDDGTSVLLNTGTSCAVTRSACTETVTCDDGTSLDIPIIGCQLLDMSSMVQSGCAHTTISIDSTEIATTAAPNSGGQCSLHFDMPAFPTKCTGFRFEYSFDNPGSCIGTWIGARITDSACPPMDTTCEDSFSTGSTGSGSLSMDVRAIFDLEFSLEYVHQSCTQPLAFSISNPRLTGCP